MIKIISLILLCIYNVHCVTYNENTYFVNTADLSGQNFKVDWNYTETDIVFRVTAKTTGWVGFGLSPNGGMKNSDMILAWTASDGSIQFKDAHSPNSNNVIYDTVQNWERLYYSQSNGATTVIFKRAIKVCNPNQPSSEINIEVAATQYVIYAWGTGFSNNLPSYHGSSTRGAKFLPVLGSLNKKITLDMSQVETIDYNVDTTIKDQQTEYFCSMHKLPDDYATTKRHVVKFDTLYQPSHEKYVHHWVLFECDKSFEDIYLKNNSLPTPGTCSGTKGHTAEWDEVEKWCTKASLAWGTGGDLEQYIPEHLGYPLGGPRQSKYFYIQWHFENSDRDQGVKEDAGVRMHFTKNYRNIEFGVYEFGAITFPSGLSIPPKSQKLVTEYMCRKNTVNSFLGSNKEMTIFAQFPHTHNAGISVYSKIVRNGTEVEYVANNEYYDNQYQYINYLQNPVKFRKDDEFILSCVYNTEYSDKFIYGGFGTKEEMCLNFIWYYPRNDDAVGCFDFLGRDTWHSFFDNLNRTGQINWYWNNDDTFFEESFQRIEESNLVNDPAKLEKIFQDFYNSAPRESYNSNGGIDKHGPIDVKRMTKDTCTDTASTTARPATTSNYFNSSTKNKNLIGLLVLSVLSAVLF